MSKPIEEFIRSTSGGGIAAEHPPAQTYPMLAAPATSDHFNTFRRRLIPFACWRLDDIRFEFDSSFVKPEAAEELTELVTLIEQHRNGDMKPPLSVFGHADPTGDDNYNKQLSGRRAQAIYGLLTRDTDLWEDLYQRPLGSDNWGGRTVQFMLETVGHSPGPVDGIQGSQTTAAIKAFQGEQDLAVDGIAGPNTRKKLFEAYMDRLCRDRSDQPFSLEKTDFLARGEDADGKGDYQGCSEFNPILLFSQEEEQEFSHPTMRQERNAENAPNRRVVVFLFHAGSRVDANRWPCPRVKEGVADCRNRFWSDGEQRRSTRLPHERRKFEDTEDTFACRFYHRMATNSPCEQVRFLLLIRVYDLEGRFIPRAPFRATLEGGKPVQGQADADGVVAILATAQTKRCLLEWGHEPEATDEPGELVFESELFLRVDEQSQNEQEEATQKLSNLGYPPELGLTENVTAFQEDYGNLAEPPITVTGQLDNPTLSLLRKVHEECADDLHEKPQ